MILVFYFHSIGNTPLSYSQVKFEWLISSLIKEKFINIKLNQIDDCTHENNYFILTFDDCFKDVLINALPIMLKYNVTGTFFPVVGYLNRVLYGSSLNLKWSQEKNSNYSIEFDFMNLDDLNYLISLNMEIGNHTLNHKNLNELSDQIVFDEINSASTFWKKELTYKIASFCYPRGKYNKDTLRILGEIDLSYACTTKLGYCDNKDKFQIHRLYPPNNKFELRSLLKGRLYNLTFIEKVLIKLSKF